MKVGAESRNKLIAAVGLMGLAAVLVLRTLLASGPAPSPAPTPVTGVSVPAATAVTHARPAGRARAGTKRVVAAPHSIDPTLRYDWLKTSEDTKYEGTGRDIFLAQAEIPQPVASGHTDAQKSAEQQGTSLPPPPPPINLKFYGFASRPGEPKKVFLSQGEDVFIASEGQIIDRRYKVVRISPMSVEIEDVLNNNRQSIPLTQG